MINVSKQASAAIDSSSRTFLSRFLFAGSEISGEVRSLKVYKGSCGETQFIPGSIYSSYIEAVLDNCTESLEGKELQCQIGVIVEGEPEWYDIGCYTVYKPSTSAYTTSFVALGRLSAKMGGAYVSALKFPAAVKDVLQEIEAGTGVAIDAADFDTSIMLETKPSGYMYREIIGFLAGLFFGYATENSSGDVVFKSFFVENTTKTDGDRTSMIPVFADSDEVITGIKVVVRSGSDEEETASEISFASGIVNIAVQNPFMTQAIFDVNKENLMGFSYRPGTVTISMGDFRLEPFDTLDVTDSVGVTRQVPCMSVVHTFDGGIITEIIAPAIENSEGDSAAFRGQLGQTVERFQKEIESAKLLIADKVSAGEVEALKGRIDTLTGDFTSFRTGEFETLKAKQAEFENTTVQNLTAVNGNIETITGDLASYKVVVAQEFEAQDAKFENLSTNFADITFANIDTANINKENVAQLFANLGLITTAVIENGHVTGYLDSVSINANTIKAGTLSVDRLILNGDEESIVYALNNMGELVSTNVDSLDGGILTDRTVTADKLVAHSITADEITTSNIMGSSGWINLVEGTFNYGNKISWDGSTLYISAETITAVADSRYTTPEEVEVTVSKMRIGVQNIIRNSKNLIFEKYYFRGDTLRDERECILNDENDDTLVA